MACQLDWVILFHEVGKLVHIYIFIYILVYLFKGFAHVAEIIYLTPRRGPYSLYHYW